MLSYSGKVQTFDYHFTVANKVVEQFQPLSSSFDHDVDWRLPERSMNLARQHTECVVPVQTAGAKYQSQ